MKYQWIFFDADETLFSFDAFAGLQKLFSDYGVDFQQSDFTEFQRVNKPLWVQYQQAEISAEQLQVTRFASWAKRLNKNPVELNDHYLIAMADICKPLENVVETLTVLKEQVNLGIITNGFTTLQKLRLEKTGLSDWFQFVTISEEVGIAKPDPRIFEHSLALAKVTDRRQVLMVGDNLDSDILGGHNADLDTCWLHYDRENHSDIQPTYSIDRFDQLLEIVSA
ncbi:MULTISPECIES: pyrimidine 5'-nucleotidase [Pasteurella]|uniref:pyrimidine 5'-nucleotidase n=1 Tax=Pasteurella TaxID=745 RepID=UPI00076BF49A|nr:MULTISPECIES: pyrimidine 5'-nucleotidase [Pasteurella]AMM82223.1 dUMP phosphatase [Pasteurella multocida subsp. multocida PMTB2.1]APW56946.1 noncanonical pyrimidine nucleotidase, YjjG family [Pasteurella multocida]ATC20558.1 noncanonical pyrimidine nucleotidase, YjjG family [Pasteurella multocida]AXQ71527.1 dUMP phosphatase [Pasteurella multocida subsp. multocida]KWW09863.1 dUMP phosphatase [Pasteurella multocida]